MDIIYATKILLALYAGFILFFVVRGAMKTKSMSDFAIGSGFSPFIVGLSLAASITSAATFIINPGFVAMFGLSAYLAMAVVVPMGLYLSLVVLSKSFLKFGSSFKALTLAQWMSKRYNSRSYGVLMGVLTLLMITFIVLICVGIVKIIAAALHANELYVLIGLVIFVFGYIMFGGANSMIYTNAFQAILMGIVAFILIFSGSEFFENGIQGFFNHLNAIDPALSQPTNPSSPIFRDYFEIIFCNFIIGVAIVCQPHIITRSLMLRSPSDINKYLIVTIVVETLFFMVMLAGFYARIEMPDLMFRDQKLKMDGIMSAYVLKEFTTGIGVLVIFGLLSSGLSTLEGLVQSISTTITNDIFLGLSRKEYTERQVRNINRFVIILLAIVTISVSYQQLINPNLSVAILGQNGVYAFFSAAFAPVLFGIFIKEVKIQVPVSASISAIVIYFSVYYGQLSFYTTGQVRNPAVAGTYAIIGSLLISGLVYLLTRRNSKSTEPNQLNRIKA